MATSRLSTALIEQDLVLPDGIVRIIRPNEGYDLSELERERVEIAHGFYPTLADWQAQGYATAGEKTAPTVIVVVPRSKSLARKLVLDALDAATDLVIVDGQKVDGVDSIFKSCRAWADIQGTITKAHGRMFWFKPSGARPDWDVAPKMTAQGHVTAPGAFSEGAIDKGSRQLAAALPPLKGRVADLGAGWGFLSQAILSSDGVTHLDMIEAEQIALDCLAQNISDPRAHAIWGDATRFKAAQPYDVIVSNPPFHTTRKGEPDLGRAFIAAAAKNLTPRGTLYLVANRHLPYEDTLSALFAKVTEIGGDGGFKLFEASRPKR